MLSIVLATYLLMLDLMALKCRFSEAARDSKTLNRPIHTKNEIHYVSIVFQIYLRIQYDIYTRQIFPLYGSLTYALYIIIERLLKMATKTVLVIEGTGAHGVPIVQGGLNNYVLLSSYLC